MPLDTHNYDNNMSPNNHISIVLLGHVFKGTGSKICTVVCVLERTEMSYNLDLTVPSKLLSVTFIGREFQILGMKQWNAHLAKSVLINSSESQVVMPVNNSKLAIIYNVLYPSIKCTIT